MEITEVTNEDQLYVALNRIDDLINSKAGTPEFDELVRVSMLVKAYEDIHYKIDPPNNPEKNYENI